MIRQPITQIVGKRRAILLQPYHQAGITVPEGFVYDGASIPSVFWSVIRLSPFGRILGAATIHDWLYANAGRIEEGYYSKSKADIIFYNLMRESDISWIQCKLAHWAVSLFGRYKERAMSEGKIEKLVRYLKQPSTWQGITAIAAAAGYTLTPDYKDAFFAAGALLLGLIQFFKDEDKAKPVIKG